MTSARFSAVSGSGASGLGGGGMMLGTVANSFGGDRWWFLSGTLLASLLWFFGLGYGARMLRGLFARPAAWRVPDSAIAVVMGALGIGLLAH